MNCIVYSSTAVGEPSSEDLRSLLEVSRRNNERDGLSGLLLYRSGRFVQLIEGERDAVDARMAVIAEDPRHTRMATLLTYDLERRQFPDWTMGFDAPAEDVVDLSGYRTSLSSLFDTPADSYTPLIPALRELMRWYMERPTRTD